MPKITITESNIFTGTTILFVVESFGVQGDSNLGDEKSSKAMRFGKRHNFKRNEGVKMKKNSFPGDRNNEFKMNDTHGFVFCQMHFLVL